MQLPAPVPIGAFGLVTKVNVIFELVMVPHAFVIVQLYVPASELVGLINSSDEEVSLGISTEFFFHW